MHSDEVTNDIRFPIRHRGCPVIVLEDVAYGAHDGLFTCWERIDTGEQVTDFRVSDKLDAALRLFRK